MKIVIDAFGGDYAPNSNILGAIKATEKHKDLKIVLTGNETIILSKLDEMKADLSRFEIVNANQVITYNDHPAESIRTKTDSSLVVAYDYLKKNDDCIGLISAGNSGAILSGALLKLGRIKGVLRPALAPLLPTKKGTNVLIVDCGANVDCKPEFLEQFAILGNIYYKSLFNIEAPRVGLLNIGTEEEKGNEFYKEVHERLKKLPINFIGNTEARDLTSGDVDIVVCDGFAGNVLLKATEGGCLLVLNELKQAIKSSFGAKIGALFMKKSLKNAMSKLDYNKYSAPFLGVKKTVIKSHGTSKPETIAAAIDQVVKLYESGVNDKIVEQITQNTQE